MNTPNEAEIEKTAQYFFHHAQTSLVKAAIFRSIALTSVANCERIPAVITGYYALFHLTIAIMYFRPELLDKDKKREMFSAVLNFSDPTPNITHRQAIDFVKKCKKEKLNHFPAQLTSQLIKGKKMREFVNYAPRITLPNSNIIGDSPTFHSLKYSVKDLDRFVYSLDQHFENVLLWLRMSAPFSGGWVVIAVSTLEQFLDNLDLGYRQWLSSATLIECRRFIRCMESWIQNSRQSI